MVNAERTNTTTRSFYDGDVDVVASKSTMDEGVRFYAMTSFFEYDADSDGRPRFGSMSTFLKGGFYVSPTTSATTDGMSGTELSGSFLGRLAEERRKNYRKEIKKKTFVMLFFSRGHCF